MPAMPWAKPGTTPVSGNVAGWPRCHDESKTWPSAKLAPTYWTLTVDDRCANAPVPRTRSRSTRVGGGDPTPAEMTGAVRRSVALATAGAPPMLRAVPAGRVVGPAGTGAGAGAAVVAV